MYWLGEFWYFYLFMYLLCRLRCKMCEWNENVDDSSGSLRTVTSVFWKSSRTGSSGPWLLSWRGSSWRWSLRIRVNSRMNTASLSLAHTATWNIGMWSLESNTTPLITPTSHSNWIRECKCEGTGQDFFHRCGDTYVYILSELKRHYFSYLYKTLRHFICHVQLFMFSSSGMSIFTGSTVNLNKS